MNQDQFTQAWVKENGNLIEYAGELSMAASELEKKFNDPFDPTKGNGAFVAGNSEPDDSPNV